MRFYKLSGSGNDFLALVEPEAVPAPEEIRAWCRRGVSIGADGLIVIRRAGATNRRIAEVEMTYWNADGYPADLCLNGTRCAARLALHLGWMFELGSDDPPTPANDDPIAPPPKRVDQLLAIRTAAGTLMARSVSDSRIALDLAFPQMEVQAITLEALGTAYEGHFLTVGVPHLVLLWPEALTDAPVETLGPPLRRHPDLGPAGANVNFVRFPEEGDRHRMEIRTFERGVEGETLSCGSGVLAATAVGLSLGIAKLPLAVFTQSGFELRVTLGHHPRPDSGKRPESWTLIGDARIVASGELWPEAGASPPAPPWEASR